MTVDHREAGTVYPVFSEFRYMTDDPPQKTGINSSCFSMIIRHVTNLTENRGSTVPTSL
jgi:hypothetical protein